MPRRRLGLLAAMPLLAGAMMIGSATGASAAPSENASCVAQGVRVFGPPGQIQRRAPEPRFGQFVSATARQPRSECPLLPS